MTSKPDRIRVAHIITKLAVGGAQESALTTCVGLDPEAFEQVLVSGVEVDSEGSLLEEARAGGVRVELQSSLVRAPSPLRDLQATWGLVRWLRRYRPDIVHTHSSKAGFVGRVAARVARVPVTVHSVHGWSFNDEMRPVARRFYITAERFAARLTDALVVESSTDVPKGLAHRIGRARQYVLIRNGIDLERFEAVERAIVRDRTLSTLGVPGSAWVIGTVGRLAEQKDPLLMVEAFALVRAQVPEAHFVWVGDGPLRDAATARAAELGVADRFHLVGLRRDVPEVLGSLDVFALSSRWEGLPRTITEAMAVGLPVVATSVDGTAEVIEQDLNGMLVESGDARSLADRLVAIHTDPGTGQRLGAASRRRARLFSSELMNHDLSALYRQLASGGRPQPARRPLKVLHVITGLNLGGAERQLLMLVRGSDPSRFVHEVISLTDVGPVGQELAAQGWPVTAMKMRSGRSTVAATARLRRHMSRSGADLVQTWLYHADLVGGLSARSLGLPVVWNVRMSWMDPASTKRTTMLAARACARLSRRIPARTVFNSLEGMQSHVQHGYDRASGVYIGNAVDTELFTPDDDAHSRLAGMLGLAEGSHLIGLVARFDPQKGHEVMLDAMRTVASEIPSAHLVLVGDGCTRENEALTSLVVERRLEERTHLLGPRSDVAMLTPGFDVAVSASRYGESSSNAVVEALASGVPVVATDVGAARSLVDCAGRVVPSGSAAELARALVDILRLGAPERMTLEASARRMALRSDVVGTCERYASLWEAVVGCDRSDRASDDLK